MAAAACWTWNSNDDPPVIVPSMYLWSMRRYSASVTGSSIIVCGRRRRRCRRRCPTSRRRSRRAPAGRRARGAARVEVRRTRVVAQPDAGDDGRPVHPGRARFRAVSVAAAAPPSSTRSSERPGPAWNLPPRPPCSDPAAQTGASSVVRIATGDRVHDVIVPAGKCPLPRRRLGRGREMARTIRLAGRPLGGVVRTRE